MRRHCFLAASLFGLWTSVAGAATRPACDMTAYMKVTAACLTGRAQGFEMPLNSNLETYGDDLTTNWNEGPYSTAYKGPAFTPTGPQVDGNLNIMPPYNWGAVGQSCDQSFDPATHAACVDGVNQKLMDPIQNASYAQGLFYWKHHGHNCHDAAEDVGTCVNNAAAFMPSDCDLEAKIVVWDSEPDIKKALGNVYHSQVLIKRLYENPTTKTPEPMICLMESQAADGAGTVDNTCCTTNLKIFDGTETIDTIATALKGCPALYYTTAVYPHVYDVATFRQQRQTGAMDMPSTYNRNAGVDALKKPAGPLLGGAPSVPQIVGAAYDDNGVAIMLNVK